MALNCWVIPTGTVGLAWVTDIADRIQGITVTVVCPEMLPWVTVMVAIPGATAATNPP